MLRIQPAGRLDNPSLECLFYFCQRLNEQLYDFSDPSYKSPALNTFTRTLELQVIAGLNHQAGIGKAALIAFVDELEWSVDADPALTREQRGICKHHIQAVRDGLGEPGRIAKSLAGLRISLGDYYRSICLEIVKIIKDEPSRKDDLERLSGSFVVQAEFYGYPRRHTYHTVKDVIYRRLHRKEVGDCDSILSDFFGRFEGESTYQCIMIANDSIRNYPKMLGAFNLRAIERAQIVGLNERQLRFLESRGTDQCFILAPEIKSVCAVHAQEVAASRFESLASLVNYEEHRIEIKRSKLSLVERVIDGKKFIVRDGIDPMHGWSDRGINTSEKLDWLYSALNEGHFIKESQRRINRAVQYHADALQDTSFENKLIDLWAALEGLLSTPRKDVARIEFFAESILPSLTLAYPRRIFASLRRDVAAHPDIEKIVRDAVSADLGDDERLAIFVCLDKYKNDQKAVCELLKGFNPLLLNRFSSVNRRFSTWSKYLDTIIQHRSKVKWHIERIYAMRNSIMHNARALPHLSTLVMNLHEYIDSLISGLAHVAVDAQERVSIEGALQHLSAAESYRLEKIREMNKAGDVMDDGGLLGLMF